MATSSAFARLPANIRVEWLRRKCSISMRAEQQGHKFAVEDYICNTKVIAVEDTGTFIVETRCYRSLRKNERPHNFVVTFRKFRYHTHRQSILVVLNIWLTQNQPFAFLLLQLRQ